MYQFPQSLKLQGCAPRRNDRGDCPDYRGNFALDPATDDYADAYTQDDLVSQSEHGEIFHRQLDTPYFYEFNGAGNLADLWLHAFGRDN